MSGTMKRILITVALVSALSAPAAAHVPDHCLSLMVDASELRVKRLETLYSVDPGTFLAGGTPALAAVNDILEADNAARAADTEFLKCVSELP